MWIKLLKQPFQYKKITIEPTASNKKTARANNGLQTMKRLWRYLLQYKWKLFGIILLVIASTTLALLGPFLVGTAVDTFIVTKKADGLGALLLILLLVYIGHSLAVFLQNFWMVGIAQQTVYTLRQDVFHSFHELPISYFNTRQQGELMSRVTNDIDNINNTLNESVIQIFASVITLIGTVTVMLILSPLLTLITMTIIPLLFIGMRWITKRTGPLFKLQQQHLGEVNGYVEETISGQHIVKTYSQETAVTTQFQTRNYKLKQTSFWAQTFSGFIPKVMNTLNFLSFALIALFGGILAIKGHITVGVIIIFAEYARQFTRPLNDLANQFNIVLSAIAGAERIFAVLDEKHEATGEEDAEELKQTKGHIVFDDVSFAYEKQTVLSHIHFEAKPGQAIAFVGHTGAGKSTIINLLTRFYSYDQGHIYLDGKELTKITRASLRKQMAFVLQDSFILEGTIRENIRYGRLDATNDEVVTAAKAANAHDFITRLPNGYDTMISQENHGISQGQLQLLTIARAIITNPAILILDEATSNIDTITEIKIQEALKKLMQGRTSFIIAHRLNTIQHADKIILLQDGKIVEQGSHKTLLKQNGAYAQLYKRTI